MILLILAFFIVVQNKKDIAEKKVPEIIGEHYAKSIGCSFCSVSAATGEGIEELFNLILIKDQRINKPLSLVIKKTKRKNNKHYHNCVD